MPRKRHGTKDLAHSFTQAQIGSWLQIARKQAKVTQPQAADYLRQLPGFEKTREGKVSRWENGTHPVPAEAFLALVALYSATSELPELIARWVPLAKAARRGVTIPNALPDDDIEVPDHRGGATGDPRRKRQA